MEEKNKKEIDNEKDLYSWQIEFRGFIEIKGRYEVIPTGYPMLRHLERAIKEAVEKEKMKFRLYDYMAKVRDFAPEDDEGMDWDFESDD